MRVIELKVLALKTIKKVGYKGKTLYNSGNNTILDFTLMKQ